MNDEQWETTIDRVEKQFGVSDRGKEALEDVEGWREWIEFEGGEGKMKLERVVRQRVKLEKTTFSKRIGSGVVVKKVYDPNVMVSFIRAYRWNEGSDAWDEIKHAL